MKNPWNNIRPFVYVIGGIAILILAMYGIYELMELLW